MECSERYRYKGYDVIKGIVRLKYPNVQPQVIQASGKFGIGDEGYTRLRE